MDTKNGNQPQKTESQNPFWKTILTEDDGNSVWSLVHVMIATGFVTFIGLAIYSVVILGHDFNPVTFGAGLGAIVALGATGIYANAKAPSIPGAN